MSNTRKATAFKSVPQTDSTEEILEGEIIDDSAPRVNRVKGFITKHKTWFVVGAAATGGFLLHGFLGRPDTCTVDLELEDYESDDDDSSEEDE